MNENLFSRGVLQREPSGAPGKSRTCGQRFRKALLYPLSYEGGKNGARKLSHAS